MSGPGPALGVSLMAQGAALSDLIGFTSALPMLRTQDLPWASLAYVGSWAAAMLLCRQLARVASWPVLTAAAQAGFAAGCGLVMFTDSWPLLLVARAVQGCCCALMLTFALGLLLAHGPRRGAALRANSGAALAGALLAHTLAAGLVPAVGWRVLLAPGLVLAACSAVLSLGVPRGLAPAESMILLPRALVVLVHRRLVELADGIDVAADCTEQAIATLTGRRAALPSVPAALPGGRPSRAAVTDREPRLALTGADGPARRRPYEQTDGHAAEAFRALRRGRR
ncbi:hypothetical protein ACIBHX_30880 [Nonomuraea sp. NPDC050536]|uniref:hypothetical protein n=1 Tax=Nonomuraea sp. NPDC050536 TaxID=3364366 RepID=UPI0037C63016